MYLYKIVINRLQNFFFSSLINLYLYKSYTTHSYNYKLDILVVLYIKLIKILQQFILRNNFYKNKKNE